MRLLWRATGGFALAALVPSTGSAQTPSASATVVASHAPAPDASADPSPAPKASSAGAARRKPAANGAPTPRRGATSTPDALRPGFETLPDGSSRLFVELSQPVTYSTKSSKGSIVYVLKGAHTPRRNNFNPLVTVHFNTPVSSARLVPHGADLWFVVALRAAVQPTVTMDAGESGGAVLRIAFPKGDYVPQAPGASNGSPAREDTPPPDP